MTTNTSTTLTELVAAFANDAEKFYEGNNAAGARARKTLQEIVKYGRLERKNIQETKNTRKGTKKA
jgi:chromosome condensin MukBEF complex kleisin-like MukF subunit